MRQRFKSHVIIPDTHVPFHDVSLINKICNLVEDIKPDGLVISGDFMDLFSLSQYVADSVYQLRNITLEMEYKEGNKVLDQIDAALPKGAEKHYLYGNHEDRYLRELKRGDRGKYGDALLSPAEALNLKRRGYKVYDNWQDDAVPLGAHLEVIHGLFTNQHAAWKHLQEFQGSVMLGHTHRFQTYHMGKTAAFNIGCTCDIHSKGFQYMPKTKRLKWTQGFAIVRIDESGFYYPELIQAWKGRFFANGRFY